MALSKITNLSITDDTIGNADINSSAAIALSKLASTPATLTGSTNNEIVTVTGANAIQGEATLTYDGTQLVLTDSNEGTDNLLVKTTADGSISMAVEKSDMKFDIGLDYDNAGSQNFYIRERHQGGSNTNAVRLLIDSAGNVGIGETTPLGKLHVKESDSGQGTLSADADTLVLETSSNTGLQFLSGTGNSARIYFGDSGDIDAGYIYYAHDDNAMLFGANGAERMRINSSGQLLYNTAATFGDVNALVYIKAPVTNNPLSIWIGSNGYKGIRFYAADESEVGSVTVNSLGVAFNATSDYRLKENETAITDGITRIKQLKPYRFNFKKEPDNTFDGFFAHEVFDIVPEAITGEKDAMIPEVLYADKVLYTEEVLYTADDELPEGKEIGDIKYAIGDMKTPADELPEGKNFGDVKEETKIEPQGIDQSKLVPLLVAAVKELTAKVEALENA